MATTKFTNNVINQIWHILACLVEVVNKIDIYLKLNTVS